MVTHVKNILQLSIKIKYSLVKFRFMTTILVNQKRKKTGPPQARVRKMPWNMSAMYFNVFFYLFLIIVHPIQSLCVTEGKGLLIETVACKCS